MIHYMVYWLNCIPKEGQDRSPREIIMGAPKLDFQKVCRLPFGSYVQVHNDDCITNIVEARATGAVNLDPMGNLQGGHRFLNLTTGSIIVCINWTELPIPTEVIMKLEELSDGPDDNLIDILNPEHEEEEQVNLEREEEE